MAGTTAGPDVGLPPLEAACSVKDLRQENMSGFNVGFIRSKGNAFFMPDCKVT
jgi:hypothetical protein